MKYRDLVLLGTILTALTTIQSAPGKAEESVKEELKAIKKEVKALRHELEEQGEMIQTLYNYADSHINFERIKTKKQQEEGLLLEPKVKISDPNLTSVSDTNPVSPKIAAITGDGDVRIYNKTGELTQRLQCQNQFITSISYSPDGKFLLVGTKTGSLLTWDFTSKEWTAVAQNVSDSIRQVAWLKGNSMAAWGSYVDYYGEHGEEINRDKPAGGVIVIESGKTKWTFKSDISNDFQALSSSPTGDKLAILEIPGKPRGAYMLDSSTGKVSAKLFHSKHSSGPLSVNLAPDNTTVAVGYAPRDIILWNAKNEKLLKILKGHSNWVVSLDFSSNGRFLISGAGDSTARIWSVDSGKELGRIKFPGRSTYVDSVGFSPNAGKAFAMADGMLIVVDTPSSSTHQDIQSKE